MTKSACMWLGLSLALASAGAAAQTVTGSGTTNTVPVFTGTSTVGNSPISVSGSSVAIGTATPYSELDVHLGGSGGNGLTLSEPSPGNAPFLTWLTGDSSYNRFSMRYFGGASGMFSIGAGDMNGFSNSLNIAASSGNVGIGTTTPGSTLEVNGNVKLTSGSGASLTFADGTKQTTAWTGVLCGGDYAEDVETTGDKAAYEPGDVLVISASSDKDVQRSQEPYSTSVAGIYATKPGVVGKRETLAKASDDIPMAMVGIVPTKVSAENGPIHRGDLLVTSSRAGYAMKGTDRGKMLGAVIGKAMGSLESGTGTIEVLVTLQ